MCPLSRLHCRAESPPRKSHVISQERNAKLRARSQARATRASASSGSGDDDDDGTDEGSEGGSEGTAGGDAEEASASASASATATGSGSGSGGIGGGGGNGAGRVIDERPNARPGDTPIDTVLLVGGATRIPMVQRLVSAITARPVSLGKVDPDEAVALGAAIQAGILSGTVTNLETLEVWQAALMRALAVKYAVNQGPGGSGSDEEEGDEGEAEDGEEGEGEEGLEAAAAEAAGAGAGAKAQQRAPMRSMRAAFADPSAAYATDTDNEVWRGGDGIDGLPALRHLLSQALLGSSFAPYRLHTPLTVVAQLSFHSHHPCCFAPLSCA